MAYILPDGNYYNASDHVADGSVPCQEKPTTGNPILIDDPLSDPMNCWREKTPQELDDEKTARATKLNEPEKAFAALIEQLWDNSAELQLAFSDGGVPGNGYKAMKQDAILRYKDKINGG